MTLSAEIEAVRHRVETLSEIILNLDDEPDIADYIRQRDLFASVLRRLERIQALTLLPDDRPKMESEIWPG